MRRERTIIVRTPECRVPWCHREATCRGLCRSCYQQAYLLVAKIKAVSWKDLEESGKVEATTSTKEWLLKK